jgi:hypothetical protein
MAYIKQTYGSVMKFVITERLHWGDGDPENIRPCGRPFEFAGKVNARGNLQRIIVLTLSHTRRPEDPLQRLAVRSRGWYRPPGHLDQVRTERESRHRGSDRRNAEADR